MSEFDFDEMMELHKENPEEFEKRKTELLTDAINKFSDDPEIRQRLEATLFAQEQKLKKFKDPAARFNEVQRQFHSQVGKFTVAINNPDYLKLQEQANILKFKDSDQS